MSCDVMTLSTNTQEYVHTEIYMPMHKHANTNVMPHEKEKKNKLEK